MAVYLPESSSSQMTDPCFRLTWLKLDPFARPRNCNMIALIIIAAFPADALANSMAPALALVSLAGWLAMPLIVIVEALFYRHKQLNNPLKLSVYANLVSGVIGLLLALVTAPIMVGPVIEEGPFLLYVLGAIFTILAVGFHWWLSSVIEYRFSRWHKLWQDTPLTQDLVFRANGISYGLIVVFLGVLRLMRA